MKALLLLLLSSLLQHPVQAATPSPDIDKVEEFTDNLTKLVKGTTSEENLSNDKPKSFFGTITKIDQHLIIISSENQNKKIQLDNEATFINSKRQKTKVDNFTVGQTILAMGYPNTDNSLDCRRIVATDTKDVENNNQITTGQIVDVPQSENSIFAFTPFQNKDVQYQIKFDSKTRINDTNEKKLKSSNTIIKGTRAIIIMHPDAENSQTFYATKIIQL